MAKSTLISAPGKVLIAGGYLVLDPLYSGIVVSTSSRFYTHVLDADGLKPNRIRVRSPQFVDATWNYLLDASTLSVQPESSNMSKNKFVHLAIQNTLGLAAELKGSQHVKDSLKSGIEIVIMGDNDFYSQRAKLEALNLPRTLSSLSKIPSFTSTGVTLSNVHKTGLGSSAALITSLVTALLIHLDVIPKSAVSDSPESVSSHGRKLAHNLAQFIHCLAQGKVGSGFDVSSAVFGSQLYTRFEPAVIAGLMGDDTGAQQPKLADVVSPSNSEWTHKVQPFQLPPHTRIMLADVDAGSDTPSLVGKVLKWRKDNADEALKLWTTLDELNQSLARTLLNLSELHDKDSKQYTDVVKQISSLHSSKWQSEPSQSPVIAKFFEAHHISQKIRKHMKQMGDFSGVPIEPDSQTKLIDTCIELPGVIGGGVPGGKLNPTFKFSIAKLIPVPYSPL
jgi:phosphomevalonate kinase